MASSAELLYGSPLRLPADEMEGAVSWGSLLELETWPKGALKEPRLRLWVASSTSAVGVNKYSRGGSLWYKYRMCCIVDMMRGSSKRTIQLVHTV